MSLEPTRETTEAAPETTPDDRADAELESPSRVLWNLVSRCGLYGAAGGAAAGAVAATMEHVPYAMTVGAGVVAVIGYLLGTNYGLHFALISRSSGGGIVGGLFGAAAGAAVGVVAGSLVIAYFGAATGSIAGSMVGYGLPLISKRLPGPAWCGAAGALVGAGVEAWTTDANATMYGLLWGLPSGAAAGLALAATFLGVLIWLDGKRQRQG